MACNVHAINASIPDVHVIKKFPDGKGKYFKMAYSDVFITAIYNQNVKMRIAYCFPQKNNPAVIFEILTKDSKIYKNMAQYVNSLAPRINELVNNRRKAGTVVAEGNNYWYLYRPYMVAGTALGLVRLTYDDLSSSREECIGVTFPLSLMDCQKYKREGQNHWKDMLSDLCNGDVKRIEYNFYPPYPEKTGSVELPVTAEMALVIQRVVNAYNNKK